MSRTDAVHVDGRRAIGDRTCNRRIDALDRSVEARVGRTWRQLGFRTVTVCGGLPTGGP